MKSKVVKKAIEVTCIVGISVLVSLVVNIKINEDNKQFTKEDIQRYKEYKQSLINEYGEDIYNLMNQEAGIENEAQSFYHFMEYGI